MEGSWGRGKETVKEIYRDQIKESQEVTRQSRDRGVQLWLLSLVLQNLHQDPSYTLLEGRTIGLRKLSGNDGKRKFFEIVGLEARRRSWGFAQEFHTRCGGIWGSWARKSRNKRSVTTDKGELWIGEEGVVGESMGDTGSYLEEEGNLSSDIGEEIWRKEGEGKTGERFDNDCMISLIKLLIARNASLRVRRFCRFRIRFVTARDFRRDETCGSTKSLTYYIWSG